MSDKFGPQKQPLSSGQIRNQIKHVEKELMDIENKWRNSLLDLHNEVRKSDLTINENLNEAAQSHAETMSKRGRLTHSGLTRRVKSFGYNYTSVAENVAGGQRTPEEVFNSWMRSMGHRHNILGNYRDVGFGRSGNFWCVIFGNKK